MGKPLISDIAMRGMYRSMQHLAAEQRSAQFALHLPRALRGVLLRDPIAVPAALFSQLHRRDTVLTEGDNPLVQTAQDTWFAHAGAPAVHATHGSAEACAAIAAGMALRIADRAARQHGDTSAGQSALPVVVALLRSFPPLSPVLQLLQQHDLALLLVVGGESDSRADAQRRTQSTTVPILSVDRADAVALCRVLQECLLRARNGWGGAVIHATQLPLLQDPLLLMRQHLEKRSLAEVEVTTAPLHG